MLSYGNQVHMERWRALDAILSLINGIDVSDCKTPEEAKRRIYGVMIGTRPNDIGIHIRNQDERIQELLEANNREVESRREVERALVIALEDRARFPDKPDFVGRMIEAHIGNLKAGKETADQYARDAMSKLERLTAALDPNSTKAAYIGEFKFKSPSGRREYVIPWPTIKEIMATIRKRAGLS